MTAGVYQPGRSALLKYGSQSSPETYSNVSGLRNVSCAIDSGAVDVTNKDSGGFQTMLPGAGTWKLTVSADGLFDSGVSLIAVLGKGNVVQATFNAEIVFGNGDKWVGLWVVMSYNRTGSYQDAETYSLSLASSGTMVFTAGT